MHSPYAPTFYAVAPTVFIAGPVKSGTTSMFACVDAAFQPNSVCGGNWDDVSCQGRRFVLHALKNVWNRRCFAQLKETQYAMFGYSDRVSWRKEIGPPVPLQYWKHGCANSIDEMRELNKKWCLDAQRNCTLPSTPAGITIPKAHCELDSVCDVCEGNPGFLRFNKTSVVHLPCSVEPKSCNMNMCHEGHNDTFHFQAFPHKRVLASNNITSSRVLSIEGNPSVLNGRALGSMSRALAALTATWGRDGLRFIVGFREPMSLGLSHWAWIGSTSHLAKGPAWFFQAGIAGFRKCARTVQENDDPALLLQLNDSQALRFQVCLQLMSDSNRPVDVLSGGLYALHFTTFFRLGFKGSQFLLVPTDALNNPIVFLNSVSRFLGLGQVLHSISKEINKTCGRRAASTSHSTIVHNTTLGQIIKDFMNSPAKEEAQHYFDQISAPLPSIIASNSMQMVGHAAWLSNSTSTSNATYH